MVAKGDDGSEGVAEVFSVEGETFEELVLVDGEPLAEGGAAFSNGFEGG